MRRSLIPVIVVAVGALGGLGSPAYAQAPPHAWLFGSWTGGSFPISGVVQAEACLSQPVVIFTADIVLRTTIADPVYIQRSIASARAMAGGTEFRFQPPSQPVGAGMLGAPGGGGAVGFGCPDPNWLGVKKLGENIIEFPGCTDYPFPLRRCLAR